MNALILVDLQNDFVSGGALAVPGGEEVVPIANRLMAHFDLVIATQDWHPDNHQSFAVQHQGLRVGDLFELEGLPQVAWPVHCVQGSSGAELVAELNPSAIDEIVRKGQTRSIDSYSGFFDNGHRQATGLEQLLRDRKVTRIYLMGLATDYCVLYTALDSARLGFETLLIIDGCRGVELQPGDCERAITQMREAGVKVVQSEDLLERSLC